MTQWMIDDLGRVWQAESEELRWRMGFGLVPIAERSRFLVTNTGFVAVAKRRGGVVIRWRPALTSGATFAALA